jgi:hypothetical protein
MYSPYAVKPLNKVELYIFTSPRLRRFIYRAQSNIRHLRVWMKDRREIIFMVLVIIGLYILASNFGEGLQR